MRLCQMMWSLSFILMKKHCNFSCGPILKIVLQSSASELSQYNFRIQMKQCQPLAGA